MTETNKNLERNIKKTLEVISLLEIREKTLREEYNWYMTFKNNKPEINYIKRHEHEVMFLCIDIYSLHEGISKKKSLFRRYFKNDGRTITKVKKVSDPNIIIVDSGSEEENKSLKDKVKQDLIEDRQNIKIEIGINSHKHEDIENWIKEKFDPKTNTLLKKINDFRGDFAHRFDDIEKIEQHSYSDCSNIIDILNIIKEVLEHYKYYLNKILIYTTGQQYSEVRKIYYDSIVRLKYEKENT